MPYVTVRSELLTGTATDSGGCLEILPQGNQHRPASQLDHGLSQDTGIRSCLDPGPEIWLESALYTRHQGHLV